MTARRAPVVFAPVLAQARDHPTVRGVHLSRNAGNVDVYVNEAFTTPIFTNLAFGHASSALTVPAGTYSVQLVAAETASPSSEDVVAALESVDTTRNENYTVFALGDDVESNTPVVVKAYSDLLPPDDGKIRVRFINGSELADNVTLSSIDGGDLTSAVVPFADETIQLDADTGITFGVDMNGNGVDRYFDFQGAPANSRINLVFTKDANGDFSLIMQVQGTDQVESLDTYEC